ncbi:hypothetical protein [Croceicoccus mobilis]|uniref:Uncharacterized protein n=1 Tax=Croceicoccus mobilis TaxID=1703339 RepID=A0A916YYD7_9SPHN|nr:hypothetical protein [Croceicoccus mobilis]GGD65693.1 hypothetical protein GCM10010990_13940 [Croceicoccus mobilis]
MQTLDCNGLSEIPTVLRIKQALVGWTEAGGEIGVLVGSHCDHDRITGSLGAMADRVRLVSAPN